MDDKTEKLGFLRELREAGEELPLEGMKKLMLDLGFPIGETALREVMGLMTGHSFILGRFFHRNIDEELLKYLSKTDKKHLEKVEKALKEDYSEIVRKISLNFLSMLITPICISRVAEGRERHYYCGGESIPEEEVTLDALKYSIIDTMKAYGGSPDLSPRNSFRVAIDNQGLINDFRAAGKEITFPGDERRSSNG